VSQEQAYGLASETTADYSHGYESLWQLHQQDHQPHSQYHPNQHSDHHQMPPYHDSGSKTVAAVLDNRYQLLEGDESTSGKSVIYDAYCLERDEEVIVKVSTNTEALERESRNYDLIAANNPRFVQKLDYIPDVADPDLAEPSAEEGQPAAAIVLERGCRNLRSFVQENGPLRGAPLKEAARAAAECVEAVHRSGCVWTEIKSENFVVKEVQQGDVVPVAVKGIDLESAVPQSATPIDFSPESCPPEFALAFLCGREPFMEMQPSFDVWSYGVVLYEMTTGEPLFNPEMDQVSIVNHLRLIEDQVDVDTGEVGCPQAKHLIESCLTVDPDSRPTISQVLGHQFFAESG